MRIVEAKFRTQNCTRRVTERKKHDRRGRQTWSVDPTLMGVQGSKYENGYK